MIVVLDDKSLIPPYEQLRLQIAALIASRSLKDGERLPAIRQLAGDLGIAPGTVARTYRELEVLGLVRTKKKGTFVDVASKISAPKLATGKGAPITRAAEAFALASWQLGVSPEQALSTVRKALAKFPVK